MDDLERIGVQMEKGTLLKLTNGGYASLDEIAEATADELALINIDNDLAVGLIRLTQDMLGKDWQPRTRSRIVVEVYRHQWTQLFEQEQATLLSVLRLPVVIEHIGSTSIEGMAAKPVHGELLN